MICIAQTYSKFTVFENGECCSDRWKYKETSIMIMSTIVILIKEIGKSYFTGGKRSYFPIQERIADIGKQRKIENFQFINFCRNTEPDTSSKKQMVV